jgi:hypothetical protein
MIAARRRAIGFAITFVLLICPTTLGRTIKKDSAGLCDPRPTVKPPCARRSGRDRRRQNLGLTRCDSNVRSKRT